MRTPTLIGLMAATAALAVLPSTAAAASPDTRYDATRIDSPDPVADGRWGERTAVARDLDGDGVNEIFVGSPFRTDGATTEAGRVHLISGRTGTVLYAINSPEPQPKSRFGFFISVPGDLDGDGKDDIVIGTDAQTVGGNVGQGRAWSFSGGKGGALIRQFDNPDPQQGARFGSRIGRAGDVTRDGVADIIIGASGNDRPAGCAPPPPPVTTPPTAPTPPASGCFINEGQAYIFDGADGTLVRRLNLPTEDRSGPACAANCGQLGLSVQGPGDTNDDGVPDQLVDANNFNGAGRMYVFDGKTGNVRLKIDSPQPEAGASFGFQDAAPDSPGDVDGDGRADLYANGFLQDGPAGEGQGRAWVFSGLDGRVIRTIDDPTPTAGGQFGFSLSRTDYNKDGRPDLYIGQSPHHVPGQDQDGGTYVFDGRDGSLLKALELPEGEKQVATMTNGGPRLGWTNAAPGDLNGDGEPDYVAGAPFADDGATKDQGRLYFFRSQVPPAGGAPGAPGTPGTPAAPVTPGATKATAKLEVARVQVLRSARRLDVLAPITKLASGRVRVEFFAAGRRTRFTAPIDSAKGQIRFSRRIPAAQANLGTGILTLTYLGDADTRPQTVRLRAASQRADLNLARPTITNGRLRANGTVSSAARGVVRVQIEYVAENVTTTLQFNARISNGRWRLDQKLSPAVQAAIARRQGTVHSYTLFTGYFPQRIRGEMESFQILGAR